MNINYNISEKKWDVIFFMKDLGLRLVSVFIVLMFCLAPLSALDLGDNDAKCCNTSSDDGDVKVVDFNKTGDDSQLRSADVDDSNGRKAGDSDSFKTNEDKNC